MLTEWQGGMSCPQGSNNMFKTSFMIGLLFAGSFLAQAQDIGKDITVDINFLKSSVTLEQASGDVALWVEDVRQDKILGKAISGESLVPATDIATSLYAYLAASLKKAGYTLVPYSPESTSGLLIRILSIDYIASRAMLKSTVNVTVVIESKRNDSDVTKTYKASAEDQFALNPSASDNGNMIGKAIAIAASACLSDPENLKAAE